VQFQHIEAGLLRAARRLAPSLHQVFHLVPFQGLRYRPFLAMSPFQNLVKGYKAFAA